MVGRRVRDLGDAETILTGAGQRVFNVTLNGATVLSNFDIYASAGGMNIAIDKTFPVTVANGQISLNFIVNVQNPKVNAIQIVPAGTYAYSQSSYYAYSQGTYYVYSQSSYYAYSQAAYYAYSQAAYTGNAVPAAFFGQNLVNVTSASQYPTVSIGGMGKQSNAEWEHVEPFAPGTWSICNGTIVGSHCYLFSSGNSAVSGGVTVNAVSPWTRRCRWRP